MVTIVNDSNGVSSKYMSAKENNMKFMIITTNGTYFIESEDFESAANEVYDNHTGYNDVVGIIKVE